MNWSSSFYTFPISGSGPSVRRAHRWVLVGRQITRIFITRIFISSFPKWRCFNSIAHVHHPDRTSRAAFNIRRRTFLISSSESRKHRRHSPLYLPRPSLPLLPTSHAHSVSILLSPMAKCRLPLRSLPLLTRTTFLPSPRVCVSVYDCVSLSLSVRLCPYVWVSVRE